MDEEKPIYVTRPLLPPLSELIPHLRNIWDSRILTNEGPYHERFEAALADHLGVSHISLFSNATTGLLAALRCLELTGEVITTPFTFAATAHSLLWNGLQPVFVDIDPVTMNMDAAKIEAAITPRTSAILPVHCYGHPCDVEAIGKIADAHHLKLVYDAAHAFGIHRNGESILKHGHMSVLSFHATKTFNTFEGGAVVCADPQTKRKMDLLRNFGIVDEVTVSLAGINGKMSEFNAAVGLLQLKHIDESILRRQQIDAAYRSTLDRVPGIRCSDALGKHRHNYSYFPILVEPDYPISRDALYSKLRDHNIFARRYFYPLVSSFPMYRELPSAQAANLQAATEVASKILCLPIYSDLSAEDQARVVEVISHA